MDEQVRTRRPEAPPAVAPARPRRRTLRILAAVLLLAVLGYAAYRYFGPRPLATAGAQHGQPARQGRGGAQLPQPVGAATIGRGDVRVILNALGTTTPLATVTVRTQIAGQLLQIGFTEGQHVQKGDFLAQVDPRPYEVTLEQAEGALARDQAQLKNAQLDLARYKTLLSQDSIARQQVDTQAALVRQYEGTIKADQGQVDAARLNLAYCRITAPVAGRVGLRQVDVGNYVQTGDTNGIVVIAQLQPISVIFALPEDDLPQIAARLRAGARLEVAAFDRANLHQLDTGELVTVDNQIDTTTGTVKMRASFPNAEEVLFPNQFVNVRLLLDTLRGTVTVPASAVQRGEPGTFVYVIRADDTVTVRPVTLGPQDGQVVAVTAGLSEGERVVTDGTDRLREGAKVTIPPPQGQQGGGARAGTQGGGTQGGRTQGAETQDGGTRGGAQVERGVRGGAGDGAAGSGAAGSEGHGDGAAGARGQGRWNGQRHRPADQGAGTPDGSRPQAGGSHPSGQEQPPGSASGSAPTQAPETAPAAPGGTPQAGTGQAPAGQASPAAQTFPAGQPSPPGPAATTGQTPAPLSVPQPPPSVPPPQTQSSPASGPQSAAPQDPGAPARIAPPPVRLRDAQPDRRRRAQGQAAPAGQ